MINTTNAYKEAIRENRILHHRAVISFKDGSSVTAEDGELFSFQIAENTSNTSSFDIGAVISNQITLKLDNLDGKYDDHDFDGAEIAAYVGLEIDGVTTWMHKGVFIAESGTDSGFTVTVSGNDCMTKLDKDYSTSNLVYPATLLQIVQDACDCCGITLAANMSAFDHSSYIVQTRPEDDGLTFREVLQWCAQISGQYATIDKYGELTFKWYDTETLEATWVEKGDFSGEYKTLCDGNEKEVDVDDSDIIRIENILSGSSFATDDVVITGVKVVEEVETIDEETGSSSTSDVSYLCGTSDYVLSVEGNKLIQGGSGSTVASWLGEKINGIQFRPMTIKGQSDPAREAGDLGLVKDLRGNYHKTIFTGVTYTAGAGQELISGAVTPTRMTSDRYSTETKIYKELRQNINKQTAAWEKSFDNLKSAMDNSGGLYPITETKEDGSTILYFCDTPRLEDAKTVVKLNDSGWGMSTDGGSTWNIGALVDGTMITKILNTVGINADWINTGALTVKDSDGNIIFQADVDGNKIILSAEHITVGNATLSDTLTDLENGIADAKNMTMILDNDYQAIPVNSSGEYVSFPTCTTTPTVMYGSKDITADCSFTVYISNSVTGSWSNTTRKYTATALSADSGWVDIKATYLQKLSVTKRFNIAKLYAGDSGSDFVWNLLKKSDLQTSDVFSDSIEGGLSGFGFVTETDSWQLLRYVGLTVGKSYTVSFKAKANETGNTSYLYVVIGSDNQECVISESEFKTFSFTAKNVSSTGLLIVQVGDDGYGCTITDIKLEEGTTATEWTPNQADIKGETGAQGATGAPGRTYFIQLSTPIIKKDTNYMCTPADLTVEGYYRDGDSEKAVAYEATWAVEFTSNDDAPDWTPLIESSEIGSTSSFTVDLSEAGSTGTQVRVRMYSADGDLLDQQTIPIILDAAQLSQEDVFNTLTNYGQDQGIYLENGKLYINGEYVNAKGLSVQDKNGSVTFKVDNDGNVSINSESVRISYNNISKWMQVSEDGLDFYQQSNGTLYQDANRIAHVGYAGHQFYKDGKHVGNIGSNQWNENKEHKGLVFDLDVDGKYMAFAQKASNSDTQYTTMLCFSRANSIYDEYGLHVGCNMYMHNYELHGVRLSDFAVKDSDGWYTGVTYDLPVCTSLSITANSDGGISWYYGMATLKIVDGLIIGITSS